MDNEQHLNPIFEFAKSRLGLGRKRILDEVEQNLRLTIQSQKRLDGGIASAAQAEHGIARRDVLLILSAIGGLSAAVTGYQSSHNLYVSRAVVKKIPEETAIELAELFRKSLNDIGQLSSHAESYKKRGQLSAADAIYRLLDYRKGQVFIGPGVTDTDGFWDSRISDSDHLDAFRGLFKSREFLRNDDPKKAREALNAIKVHNKNSLPQKLNVELMTAESLDYLKHDPTIGKLLDEVGQTFGKIWSFTLREMLEAIELFGPVAIIVHYHSSFLVHLRDGTNLSHSTRQIVEPANAMMTSLRELANRAKVDVSKECWNGCLFSSFFINRVGSPLQGKIASDKVLGETEFFQSSPKVQGEILRARGCHDNQMMYALFQAMENEYGAKRDSAGDKILEEIMTNYQAPLRTNSMFNRRFGDIRNLRDGIKPLESELLPIKSHYLYLTSRNVNKS